MTPSSPVTGATVTGLTSPTYTLTTDMAPSPNGKQWAITALGGTQTGVTAHSTTSPFTVSVFRPTNTKVLGALDQNGQLRSVAKNTFSTVFRKGAVPLAGQSSQTIIGRMTIDLPAGTDLASPAEIKAFISFIGGFIYANAQGYADLFLTNVI